MINIFKENKLLKLKSKQDDIIIKSYLEQLKVLEEENQKLIESNNRYGESMYKLLELNKAIIDLLNKKQIKNEDVRELINEFTRLAKGDNK